jgi:DNA-binding response OmpR family regulator
VESDRVVTVCVRRLREKIERGPSHPSLILTVPGIGCRLAG